MGNCVGGVSQQPGTDIAAANKLHVDESGQRSSLRGSKLAVHDLVGRGNNSSKQPSAGSPFFVLRKTDDVKSKYFIDEERQLGCGQFGVVCVATCKATGTKYAMKALNKRRSGGMRGQIDIRTEVEIMFHLGGHPNLVQLHEVYEDEESIFLILELCEGGDWFQRLLAKGTYTERHAANSARVLLRTLAYCHSLGVVHRDLKPENVLYTDHSAAATIKITDFGLGAIVPQAAMQGPHSSSASSKNKALLHEPVGSTFYVAPEVLKDRGYGKECDIWSIGILLYVTLGGCPPFDGPNEQSVFEAIMYRPLKFNDPSLKSISDEAKDFLTKMLCKDPRCRATVAELLEHPWLNSPADPAASEVPVPDVVIERLKQFAAMGKFKKQARKVLASLLPEEEVVGLLTIFREMDADGDGLLTVVELQDAISSMGLALPEALSRQLMESSDLNGDGCLDYAEFLGATVHQQRLDKDVLIFKAFKHFDTDQSGFICESELREALTYQGCCGLDIDAIIRDVDIDGDGRIDYQEFANIIRMREESENGFGPLLVVHSSERASCSKHAPKGQLAPVHGFGGARALLNSPSSRLVIVGDAAADARPRMRAVAATHSGLTGGAMRRARDGNSEHGFGAPGCQQLTTTSAGQVGVRWTPMVNDEPSGGLSLAAMAAQLAASRESAAAQAWKSRAAIPAKPSLKPQIESQGSMRVTFKDTPDVTTFVPTEPLPSASSGSPLRKARAASECLAGLPEVLVAARSGASTNSPMMDRRHRGDLPASGFAATTGGAPHRMSSGSPGGEYSKKYGSRTFEVLLNSSLLISGSRALGAARSSRMQGFSLNGSPAGSPAASQALMSRVGSRASGQLSTCLLGGISQGSGAPGSPTDASNAPTMSIVGFAPAAACAKVGGPGTPNAPRPLIHSFSSVAVGDSPMASPTPSYTHGAMRCSDFMPGQSALANCSSPRVRIKAAAANPRGRGALSAAAAAAMAIAREHREAALAASAGGCGSPHGQPHAISGVIRDANIKFRSSSDAYEDNEDSSGTLLDEERFCAGPKFSRSALPNTICSRPSSAASHAADFGGDEEEDFKLGADEDEEDWMAEDEESFHLTAAAAAAATAAAAQRPSCRPRSRGPGGPSSRNASPRSRPTSASRAPSRPVSAQHLRSGSSSANGSVAESWAESRANSCAGSRTGSRAGSRMGSRAASPAPSRTSSACSLHSRKGSTSRPTSALVSRTNSLQTRPSALSLTSPTHRINSVGVTFAASVFGGGIGEDPLSEDLKSPRSQTKRQVSFTTSSQLLARRLVELRQEAAS